MTTPKTMTPRSFWARFKPSEQLGIVNAADPLIVLMRYNFCMSERVVEGHPQLTQARQLLIATGLLTPERAAEVFDFTTAPLP